MIKKIVPDMVQRISTISQRRIACKGGVPLCKNCTFNFDQEATAKITSDCVRIKLCAMLEEIINGK